MIDASIYQAGKHGMEYGFIETVLVLRGIYRKENGCKRNIGRLEKIGKL